MKRIVKHLILLIVAAHISKKMISSLSASSEPELRVIEEVVEEVFDPENLSLDRKQC